jgi:two-component system, OmpR family, phosphate regulon sensor histidine kinase PhoR
MKLNTISKFSIDIAITAAIISGVVVLIFISGNRDFFFLFPIAAMFAVFILVYFLSVLIIKSSVAEENSNNYFKGFNDAVNREINTYSSNQTQEIDRLKEMEQYRKEYLGNVSHELKTPIFNIQGYVLTLLDGGLEDSTINLKYLERTEKSINRLISIVEDLETISRHESGELKLEREYFNIVQLVEEVFETQEIRAKKRNIQLSFDKKYKKQVVVYADKMKLFQVFTNLITNSIYYGKSGGKTQVCFSNTKNKILVEVQDNGIGIAPNDISRIFERFYRVDKSRSREQGGTGLGLAIVKHIIEAHGEAIQVKSKLKKGSSFIFSLPIFCDDKGK